MCWLLLLVIVGSIVLDFFFSLAPVSFSVVSANAERIERFGLYVCLCMYG